MRRNPEKCCLLLVLTATAWVGYPATALSQSPVEQTAEQILAKAIAYHDPNGVWESGRTHLRIHTTYSEEYAKKSGAKETTLMLTLSPGQEDFGYTKETATDKIAISVRRGQSTVLVNGSADVSQEDRERLRLREATLYRDYCEYLYGMPMKLRDPGTNVDPQVRPVRFHNRDTWQLRVTYDPDVGEETWYFYFDQGSFALVGYRFYFDEAKNDGEYIVFEGEAADSASHLRLPKSRAWYYNANDGHLATDEIISISTQQ